jgi:hypothetical protein
MLAVSVPLIGIAAGLAIAILIDRADRREMRRLAYVVAAVLVIMAVTSYGIDIAAIDSVDCTQPVAQVSCADDLGGGIGLFLALFASAVATATFWAGERLGSAGRRRIGSS